MTIGDLLAQITGGKPTDSSTTPSPAPRSNPSLAKRKPEDDLRKDVSKTLRHVSPPSKVIQPERKTGEKAQFAHRPASGNNAVKPSPMPSRKAFGDAQISSRPAVSGRLPSTSARPSVAPKSTPKKGSFAEILARGQRAQAVMGQVGKIQHKKVEKGSRSMDATKTAAGTKKSSAQTSGSAARGPSGARKPAVGGGVNNGGSARKAASKQPTSPAKPATAKRHGAEEATVKKVKKAALVDTGYSGTARPTPDNAARKKDVPRGGALLKAPPTRSSSKRPRYEDDFDEELDDFIEYDDEEEDAPPRYRYDSEGSSDMEAGLDELDVEEHRAELLARKEDIEQERIERNLKAAKEERKMQALAALREKRR
ncbi:SPT2 chromatin protein [Drechmeria coniospora]|uniref:SPT2 chromatin protein n=1 Tax=Drechmeria coniospora TaxID=98403 RepID=A0A151GIN2_DRECN|nr:SPT2 chromatin protein [Drechmeria coniospora]KYK56939.1 SPT2 chromatin protein [Drechmeria coniospora]